jgi:hypothetical protein
MATVLETVWWHVNNMQGTLHMWWFCQGDVSIHLAHQVWMRHLNLLNFRLSSGNSTHICLATDMFLWLFVCNFSLSPLMKTVWGKCSDSTIAWGTGKRIWEFLMGLVTLCLGHKWGMVWRKRRCISSGYLKRRNELVRYIRLELERNFQDVKLKNLLVSNHPF